VTDPAQVFLLGAVAVEAKSLRQVAAEAADVFDLTEVLVAADSLKDRGLLFQSDYKVIAVPVFPRIDLASYRPRRRQRPDLPWLRVHDARRSETEGNR
jgi:hypothetical protein